MTGIGLIVNSEMRQLLRVAKGAIKEIFHEPTDVFWTGRAMDLLFDGFEIDCDVTSTYSKVACQEIQKWNGATFKTKENGKVLFSMFGGVSQSNDFDKFIPFFSKYVYVLKCLFLVHTAKWDIKWSLEGETWS